MSVAKVARVKLKQSGLLPGDHYLTRPIQGRVTQGGNQRHSSNGTDTNVSTPPVRKLAVLLHADIVGSTRLVQLDETLAHRRMRDAFIEFSGEITRYAGTTQEIRGDALVAEFPRASDAVSAALAFQQKNAERNRGEQDGVQPELRIGISMGEVVIADGTVTGGGIVLAQRLEQLADPGGVCIQGATFETLPNRLPFDFDDLGYQEIKGFDTPVRAYRVSLQPGKEVPLPDPVSPRQSAPETASLEVAAIETVAAGGDTELSLPDRPSIAVLPFTDMSSDSEIDYFSDGISEDIITELSRFRSIFVIARNSTFTYKGKSVDVRTIARELGVRYVLEGSVRRAGNRIRVTAQLIDALTGNHIWAEKYDRVLEDIFDLQEQLTRAIVAEIAPHIELSETEKTRRSRPGSMTAYEIGVHAWAAAREGFGKANRELRGEAIVLAEQALAIDPGCSAAWRALAWSHWQHLYFNTTESAAESLKAGLYAANQAISIDYGDHIAHLWNGALLFLDGQHVAGLAEVRRAHELNPNDSMAMCYLGFFESVSGNPKPGIEYVDLALRLSPRDPSRFLLYNCLAWANFAACNYETGAEWGQRSIGEARTMPAAHLALVLNRVGMSEIDRARAEYKALYELAPGLVDTRLSGHWNSSWPEYTDRGLKFLRIAANLEEPD